MLDHRHGVLAGRRRIAGTVGEKHAVGIERGDVLGAGLRRHHRHLAADAGEQAQDVALDAVVDRDHVELRLVHPAVALAPLPRRLVPGKALAARHHRHEVHADQARPLARFFLQRVEVELAAGVVRDHGVGHALLADERGERAGVEAGQPDDAARLQPLVEMAGGAEVRRLGDVGAHDDAARARRRRHVDGLDVFVVGADVADMREGEGDDLPGIGRIGEDFLIAGHRGVEADLADRLARWRRGRSLPARCRPPAPAAPWVSARSSRNRLVWGSYGA